MELRAYQEDKLDDVMQFAAAALTETRHILQGALLLNAEKAISDFKRSFDAA